MTTNTNHSAFGSRPAIALLGLALTAFASAGCDTAEDSGICLPEEGCDGIADVLEREAPAPTDALETERSNSCEPASDEVSYVAEDPAACADVEVECQPGWSNIAADCGCGCEFTGDAEFRGGQRCRPRSWMHTC